MEAEELLAYTARPGEVAEWEELLLRLEIVPRVVRNAIDETGDAPAAVDALKRAVEREAEVGQRLERAAGMERTEERGRAPAADAGVEGLARELASLRARTFAMVQRRGLGVWDWRTPVGGESATVHQLLLWLAARDGELLAELRNASRPVPA